MAFPDDLPTRTDESIGRTKVNTGTYSNTSTQADAGEYNRLLDNVVGIAASLGRPTGADASSAWQAILGSASGQQQLLATGVIDAAAAVLFAFMSAPGQQVSTTGTGFAGRRLVIVVHASSAPCTFVATGGSIVGEEGNSIALSTGCVYLATDISGALQWSVVRIDADEAYDHLTTLQAESDALEARLDDLDAGVVSTIPTLTTGSGAGSYVYGGPVIYASGTGWSRELLTLDNPVEDRAFRLVYLGTAGQSITLLTTGANTLNGSAAASYVVHGGSAPRIVHVTSKGGAPTEHKVVELASYAEADALDTRLDAIEANEWVTLVRIAAAVKSAAQGVESLRQIYTSTPAAIGTAAPGSSVLAAAGDHVHAHGSQTDGTHHAAATTSVAGFMSAADKTLIDAITSTSVTSPRFLASANNTATAPSVLIEPGGNSGLYWDAAKGVTVSVDGNDRIEARVSGSTLVRSPNAGTSAVMAWINAVGDARIFVYTATPEATITANPGTFCLDTSNGRLYLKRSGVGNTGWVQIDRCESGTYTPTGTATANLDSVTGLISIYIRVGDHVSVFWSATVDPTTGAGTATTFRLTLPIASNLAAQDDLTGSCAAAGGNGYGMVRGDITNDAAEVVFAAVGTSAFALRGSFAYRVL